MQRWKRTGWCLVVGAMGVMLSACGGSGELDLSCSGPMDCLESELCHPDEKICVQLCFSIVECPTKAERCEAMSGEDPRKICKCPTKECVGSPDP